MADVADILARNSTDQHEMEYMVYRSNHAAHAIIAMHRMGAPPERIEEYMKWYNQRLIPNQRRDTEADPLQKIEISGLLGKRDSYYVIRDEYIRRMGEMGGVESLEQFIQQELLKLRLGFGGAALHGLIQAGYGYAAANPRVVAEGIAYIHHSYLPLTMEKEKWDKSFGSGDLSILDIVDLLRKDSGLKQIMSDGSLSEVWQMRNTGIFMQKVGTLLTMAGDQLANYLYRLKYDQPITSMHDVMTLGRWLMDVTLTVYAKSEKRNDFFLLHGVTGAWSLYQLLPCFKNYEDALDLIKIFLCVLMAAYLAQGSPALTSEEDFPTQAQQDYWQATIAETLAEDRDEHIFKLVQVAYDMYREASRDAQRELCIAAANTALKHELEA